MKAPNPDPQVYFLPTPIGNLGDITLRTIEVLEACDMIACEDTRHTKKLLSHLNLSKPLMSLNAQSEERKIPEIIAQLKGSDRKLAVVSDAGMPAVSDPGQRLIQRCLTEAIPYTVLPGPSAVLTAIVGSGFPAHHFMFGGFLPIKKGKKQRLLQEATEADYTTAYFESPHRLVKALTLLAEVAPDHPTCVARELTKLYETFHRGTAGELAKYYEAHPPKGEIVLVVAAQSYQIPTPLEHK